MNAGSTTVNALPVRCWTQGGPANEVWNWGDAISPLIYEYMTGQSPRLLEQDQFPAEPHLMICGSTMKWANEWTVLWGTGEIAEGMLAMRAHSKPLHVAAVRGPLTRESLLHRGIECPEIYGDPALLFPRFYRPEISPVFELGVIPHYIDQEVAVVPRLARDSGVRIIDITQSGSTRPAHSFIDDLLRCKRIASSSLHGLIAADAYGIPSIWVEFSNRVVGGGFKFRDYYRSVGRRDPVPVDLTDASVSAWDLIGAIDRERYTIQFDHRRLEDAFPLQQFL